MQNPNRGLISKPRGRSGRASAPGDRPLFQKHAESVRSDSPDRPSYALGQVEAKYGFRNHHDPGYNGTMQPVIEKQHIETTPGVCGGKPRIAGHRIRVQDIVLWTEQGESADEIVSSFPQLSLADVHAALAYYFDHQAEIDADIRQDDEFIAQLKKRQGSGPIRNAE
jgi:uncharacterized protein (DUF433 family)